MKDKVKEFEELLKEEIEYFREVKSSDSIELNELTKLNIYRRLNAYVEEEKKLSSAIFDEAIKQKENDEEFKENYYKEVINAALIDMPIDKEYYDFIDSLHESERQRLFISKRGEDYHFYITGNMFLYLSKHQFKDLYNILLHNNKLLDGSIYLHEGSVREESCGFGGDYIYHVYSRLYFLGFRTYEIDDAKKEGFEKDKRVLRCPRYISSSTINSIFESELLNEDNISIEECIEKTFKRAKQLSYEKSPEYKEKVLLDRINTLYEMSRGKKIDESLLYDGKFIDLIRETYSLPNGKTVSKEKVIKNHGKEAVIVVPKTVSERNNTNEFAETIVTFQQRMNDTLIGEFPSGYIEEGESPIEAARRELLEETGYTSPRIEIMDKIYSSPGIDGSVIYLAIANDCKQITEPREEGHEYVSFGLFNNQELDYMIENNIISGSANKLAYYESKHKTNTYGSVKTRKLKDILRHD